MKGIWDYHINELEDSEAGRIKILERQINFGPEKNEKIDLSLVKKYWNRLKLLPNRKRLMELFIYGK